MGNSKQEIEVIKKLFFYFFFNLKKELLDFNKTQMINAFKELLNNGILESSVHLDELYKIIDGNFIKFSNEQKI